MTVAGEQGLEIREELWPILFIRVRGLVREREWVQMFEAFARFYARGERYCSIVDSGGLTRVPDPASRSLIARLAKEHEYQSRRFILESNVVIDSALARGALTAITWLAPPVYPLFYVGNCRDAFARAFTALKREKLPVPEAARAFAARLA